MYIGRVPFTYNMSYAHRYTHIGHVLLELDMSFMCKGHVLCEWDMSYMGAGTGPAGLAAAGPKSRQAGAS